VGVQYVEGMWAGEDLAEIECSVEVDSGFFFRKLWVVGSEETM
jgi:hypothetical protein